jgi:lycopene cyclase domain-containing protein
VKEKIPLPHIERPFRWSFPLLFSFYPKANFFEEMEICTAGHPHHGDHFLFLWDEVFTQIGVWGFNSRYTTGIHIFSLPLEEVLFFFCIPYACVFHLFCINPPGGKRSLVSSPGADLKCADIYYTYRRDFFTWTGGIHLLHSLLPDYFLAYQMLKLRTTIYGTVFIFAFLFILVPFFIVNSILTGSFIEEPIVWYNDN